MNRIALWSWTLSNFQHKAFPMVGWQLGRLTFCQL